MMTRQVRFIATGLAVVMGNCMTAGVTTLQAATADPAIPPAPAVAPPPAITPQAEAGREPFAANCGFCHGRDAAGGSSGPDLTHSELLTADKDGKQLAELLRSGRPDKGMPAFAMLSTTDRSNISAYLHYQQAMAQTANGQRRSVAPADLATGDAGQGKRYFDMQCASCHSAQGDLAGIGARLQGLPLLRRMLYPGSELRTSNRKPAAVEVTTTDGKHWQGALAYQDEFTLALREANGAYHSWAVRNIRFTVNDPLAAHVQQLSRYTDADMHDVLAYLQSLH